MLSHNSSHIQYITYTQLQSQFHDPNITIITLILSKTQTNYTKMFLTTRGVKPIKQFHLIIQKELQYNKHPKINPNLIF